MDNAPAGSSKKSTVYVGGFAPDVREQQLLDTFVTFGTSLLSPPIPC
jgi:RNA recognition motif-containing protein